MQQFLHGTQVAKPSWITHKTKLGNLSSWILHYVAIMCLFLSSFNLGGKNFSLEKINHFFYLKFNFTFLFQQGLLNTSLPSHKPLPEYKTAVAKKPKLVFSHYGYLKCLWDVIIIIATIYVAIIVPYNAAFYGAKNDDISLDEELTVYCAGGKYNDQH